LGRLKRVEECEPIRRTLFEVVLGRRFALVCFLFVIPEPHEPPVVGTQRQREEVAVCVLCHREQPSETLFARLTGRIATEHPNLPGDMPARIVDQALAFLAACATATVPIRPSASVDIGWHTFLLHTRDYAAFCDRVAGRFINHVPDDEPGTIGPALADALTEIRRAGYHVDLPLRSTGGDCTQCHAGCHDSPKR
jgi:hypothetical protein